MGFWTWHTMWGHQNKALSSEAIRKCIWFLWPTIMNNLISLVFGTFLTSSNCKCYIKIHIVCHVQENIRSDNWWPSTYFNDDDAFRGRRRPSHQVTQPITPLIIAAPGPSWWGLGCRPQTNGSIPSVWYTTIPYQSKVLLESKVSNLKEKVETTTITYLLQWHPSLQGAFDFLGKPHNCKLIRQSLGFKIPQLWRKMFQITMTHGVINLQ